jgi:hypothetical protein
MAVPLSTTGIAVKAAISLRLNELGHALSASHIAAMVADIMAVINTNAGTVVADAAADVTGYQAPAHGKF